MAKITVKKTKDYSIVSNKILRDTNLSMKARFLLVFMLSLAENWEYSVAGLAKAVGCGKDAVTSGIKELEEYGYLERTRSRDEKGRLKEMEYVLYEEPRNVPVQCEDQIKDEHVQAEPIEEKSTQENRTQINTNITNTKLNKYQEEEERAREESATTAEVVREYNSNIHPLYSAIEHEKLLDLCDRYGCDWVSAAIREAVECNARTIRDIESVLKAWEKRGGCRDRDKHTDAVDELAEFIERGGKDA